MKLFITAFLIFTSILNVFGQNQNISGGDVFDGEPFLAVNPANPQHIVVAWMGYVPFNRIVIKTTVSFNAGKDWSPENYLPHTNALFGAADPSLAFDNSGNMFVCYIDFSTMIDSGVVYVRKSTDGGLNWGPPVEVIDAHDDPGQYPVDRPWMAIDRSGGTHDGNIYITTMPPNVFGPLQPPFHPYFTRSVDGGNSFEPYQYLDSAGWLAGTMIQQPMPAPDVSANGTFHAVYPSWVFSQNLQPQYIIASSTDAGDSFTYNTVFSTGEVLSDSLAKRGYLLKSNPVNPNHLVFLNLGIDHGDADVFMYESFDAGVNWSSAIRVNDDPIANNRMQDLIWADFDDDGDLVVSWRDRRNGADSTYTTTSEIWAAVRRKDSTTFSANFKLSDLQVPYDTILAESGNDFMCIELIDDTLTAVWGDTRDGYLNIWMQRMSIDGTPMSIRQVAVGKVPSVTVSPNPFDSEVRLSGISLREINVFDENGKLVFASHNPETFVALRLDLAHLPDGTYLFEIATTDGVVSEKVVKN